MLLPQGVGWVGCPWLLFGAGPPWGEKLPRELRGNRELGSLRLRGWWGGRLVVVGVVFGGGYRYPGTRDLGARSGRLVSIGGLRPSCGAHPSIFSLARLVLHDPTPALIGGVFDRCSSVQPSAGDPPLQFISPGSLRTRRGSVDPSPEMAAMTPRRSARRGGRGGDLCQG